MHYILDIETKPDRNLLEIFNESVKPPGNLKDPAKIEAALEEKRAESPKLMSVSSDWNEIVCVGVKPLGEEPLMMTFEEYVLWLEQDYGTVNTENLANKKGMKGIQNKHRPFITFNGKVFDIPTIMKYGIKKGADLPYEMLKNSTDKYKAQNHIDLMERLSFKWGEYVSLDTYLRIYLGIQKETCGDDFFRTATVEQLRKHCAQDLEYTEQLYEKFKPILV